MRSFTSGLLGRLQMKRSQTGGRRSRSYQYVGVRPVPQEAVVESSADRRGGWRALSHEKKGVAIARHALH
jgi:hypothetical protein